MPSVTLVVLARIIAATSLGATAVTVEDEVEVNRGLGLGTYQVDVPELTTLTPSPLRVSVESQTAVGSQGAYPLRFFIENTGPAKPIRLTFRANAGQTASFSRMVEVNAGERRSVTLPIPASLNSGFVEVEGAGEASSQSLYFNTLDPTQHEVLCIGREAELEKFVGPSGSIPIRSDSENAADRQLVAVRVLASAPKDAPDEPMAYSSYHAVIVPTAEALDQLTSPQRSALELYVLSGGTLVLRAPVRNWANFPLVTGSKAELVRYGLGTILPVTSLKNVAMPWAKVLLSPLAQPHGWVGSSLGTSWPLLPQATPPLGRFLLIIIAFTVIIGPGSLWVARRRGPSALLFTIPSIAGVTCALIIGWSIFGEGFSLHSALYSYTWLDAERSRALTFGIGGYYANLSPGPITLSANSTVISPWLNAVEQVTPSYEWKDGIALSPEFMPSRGYREWGVVSLEPTRARVRLVHTGKSWSVENALGHDLDAFCVNIEGELYSAASVANGAVHPLTPTAIGLPALRLPIPSRMPSRGALSRFFDEYDEAPPELPSEWSRFDQELADHFSQRPLGRSEFAALISGQGFMQTGGVKSEINQGQHVVRGEVSP